MDKWEIVVNVIPNWELSTRGYIFDVSVEDEDDIIWTNQFDDEELLKTLQTFRNMADLSEDINFNVYANYHGNKQLLNFYSELIEMLNSDNFHIEYEWG